MWALQGSGRRSVRPASGSAALDPAGSTRRAGARWSGWCRRTPPTCSTSRPSPRSARRPTAAPATAARSSTGWCPGIPDDQHPRDLSEGQRLALALALVLVARPRRAAARRADPRARLRRQARAGRDPARPRRRRARGAGGHPRRGVRGPGRRRRRGARRGRGRLVGPGTPGGRRVAGVRAAGHQGARCPVAAGRRGGRARWTRHEPARRPLAPRSALVLARRLARRADDAGLAAAGAGARRTPGSTRRSCSWRCCRW